VTLGAYEFKIMWPQNENQISGLVLNGIMV
jgi:hypothetical protein